PVPPEQSADSSRSRLRPALGDRLPLL
ncbi:MAG: hypothetical protein AVDCRST_MAG88-1873, partial [uncultured Thermomicrobiales bacterium]